MSCVRCEQDIDAGGLCKPCAEEVGRWGWENLPADRRDFEWATKDLERRLYSRPPPVKPILAESVEEKDKTLPQVDDSISIADIRYADWIQGVPQAERPDVDYNRKYASPTEKFPLSNENPDSIPRFVESKLGNLLLGPVKDEEDDTLASSYNC